MPKALCPSYAVPVGIPVYGLAFTSDNQLIVAGGGGAGRSGVANKLVSYKVETRRKDLEEEALYEIPNGEDAPMCLDVHPTDNVAIAGINNSEVMIKQDKNKSCKIFKVLESSFELTTSLRALESANVDDYQQVVRFSHDGSLFAAGTSNGQVHVYKYKEYTKVCPTIQASEKDEVLEVDIALENDKLVCTLRDAIKLVNLRGRNAGKVMQTVSPAALDKNRPLEFRSFRYGRGYSKETAFIVANGNAQNPGGFLYKVDAYTLERKSMVKLGKKPIQAFTISREGGMLAVASSDFTITLLDATTLRVLHRVRDAHGFSITSLAFSHDRRLLASGSADNTCRIVQLPVQFPNPTAAINPFLTVLLAVIVAMIVMAISYLLNERITQEL